MLFAGMVSLPPPGNPREPVDPVAPGTPNYNIFVQYPQQFNNSISKMTQPTVSSQVDSVILLPTPSGPATPCCPVAPLGPRFPGRPVAPVRPAEPGAPA